MYYDNMMNPQYNPYARNQVPVVTPPMQLIKVTGIEGAKAYQMAPNSSVALFDDSNDIFYVKSTDGAGFPTIRSFKFEPVVESSPVNTDYVTRKEFEELKGMILNAKQSVRSKAKSAESDNELASIA